LLALVFQNLVANALKFVPPGQVAQVQVLAVACEVPGQVAVVVADNGIGIAADDLPRLFTPFQRLHVRRLYEGQGLGLALAQQLVQAQGGHISVVSTLGEGSRFTVRLQAV
jgi:signal transduction histidine kinase